MRFKRQRNDAFSSRSRNYKAEHSYPRLKEGFARILAAD